VDALADGMTPTLYVTWDGNGWLRVAAFALSASATVTAAARRAADDSAAIPVFRFMDSPSREGTSKVVPNTPD
jgi:hypothetical protein